jgi:hypothetical protein
LAGLKLTLGQISTAPCRWSWVLEDPAAFVHRAGGGQYEIAELIGQHVVNTLLKDAD